MSTTQLSFADIKERVNIEQVLPLVGITLKRYQSQLRGVCPICKEGGDRAFVVTPAKGLYYCFGKCGTGGDMLSLVANVKQCSVREAAELIAKHMGITGKRSGDTVQFLGKIPPAPPRKGRAEAPGVSASLSRGSAGSRGGGGDLRAFRCGLCAEGHHARQAGDPDP